MDVLCTHWLLREHAKLKSWIKTSMDHHPFRSVKETIFEKLVCACYREKMPTIFVRQKNNMNIFSDSKFCRQQIFYLISNLFWELIVIASLNTNAPINIFTAHSLMLLLFLINEASCSPLFFCTSCFFLISQSHHTIRSAYTILFGKDKSNFPF